MGKIHGHFSSSCPAFLPDVSDGYYHRALVDKSEMKLMGGFSLKSSPF
jgi:hypothetical protein